jgi:hypothetical protein
MDNTVFVPRSLANHDSARNAVRPLLESDRPREFDEYKSTALITRQTGFHSRHGHMNMASTRMLRGVY